MHLIAYQRSMELEKLKDQGLKLTAQTVKFFGGKVQVVKPKVPQNPRHSLFGTEDFPSVCTWLYAWLFFFSNCIKHEVE